MTKKIKIEPVQLDIGGLKELLLTTLQKSAEPIPLNDLIEDCSRRVVGVTKSSILSSIDSLVDDGYDIKEISFGKSRLFALVRTVTINEEDMYRLHGNIHTPVLLTGDWHVGSKGFYKMAYNSLRNDVEEYNVNDVMIAGDLLQGRGVFPSELTELTMPSITDQITYSIDLVNDLNTNVHIVQGNHEERVQGNVNVGLEPLKLVAKACDKTFYYGHVANLHLNDNYHYMMMHGAGAISAATTHMIEKVWRELVNKPNVLHMGHAHQSAYVRKGENKIGVMSATLQRTSSYLLMKGLNAKIGWFILEDINDEDVVIIDRHPKIS